jgi:hypothetical protein
MNIFEKQYINKLIFFEKKYINKLFFLKNNK